MKQSLICMLFCLSAITANCQAKIIIPLTLTQGRPVLQLNINGKGPYPIVFDTGKMGDEIAIDKDIISQFNLKIIDTLLVGDPTGKNSTAIPVVKIDSVSIGPFKIANGKAIGNPRTTPDVKGVVGLAFFKDYLVTLDFLHMQLVLSKGMMEMANNHTILNYQNRMGVPVIPVILAGQTVEAQLDCGNARTAIAIPEELASHLVFTTPPIAAGKAKTLFNTLDLKQAQIKGDLVIGGYTFEKPTITFPSFGNYVNLGAAFMRQFTITFDQENQRLKLLKNK